MKLFSYASLPEHIKYNGKVYVKSVTFTTALNDGTLEMTSKCLRKGLLIKVRVTNPRVKGKTTFRGNTYKPTEWIFIEQSDEQAKTI